MGGGQKRPNQIRRPSSPRKIPPLDLEDLVNGQVLAPKQGGYILELQEAQFRVGGHDKDLGCFRGCDRYCWWKNSGDHQSRLVVEISLFTRI